ncbi:DNA-binding HxlR family transcriptional regulator [Kribbella aluminosa]|uniref:DNA-binding HxlR family transcriptional regulator n=1 Tax=Kribbella aluminosa TaxID=416017 RepID=A0ABS4UJU4_9ACTN|nr:helix-turn-helix domain-containing protein [Kribbella aluminosa]MBP2351884.1 DNA-binding HxlR family transcriptional regulator [Kribbella aluminosa]
MVTERPGDLFSADCPTRHLLDRIGDKWTSMAVKLLAELYPEAARFSELRRAMPGVSHKMLSQTLQRLAADGLVSRRVEDSVPPAVYYALTELGRSLDEPLAALRDWAETHMSEIEGHRTHGRHDRHPDN